MVTERITGLATTLLYLCHLMSFTSCVSGLDLPLSFLFICFFYYVELEHINYCMKLERYRFSEFWTTRICLYWPFCECCVSAWCCTASQRSITVWAHFCLFTFSLWLVLVGYISARTSSKTWPWLSLPNFFVYRLFCSIFSTCLLVAFTYFALHGIHFVTHNIYCYHHSLACKWEDHSNPPPYW